MGVWLAYSGLGDTTTLVTLPPLSVSLYWFRVLPLALLYLYHIRLQVMGRFPMRCQILLLDILPVWLAIPIQFNKYYNAHWLLRRPWATGGPKGALVYIELYGRL